MAGASAGSLPISFGWSFCNLRFIGSAMRAMLGENLWETLHRRRNDHSSVVFVEGFDPFNASVVYEAIFNVLLLSLTFLVVSSGQGDHW